jgi:hypothetical protein
VDHDLLESAAREDDVLHFVDGCVVLPEPRAGLGDEGPEPGLVLDPSADRVVELGCTGERLNQRSGSPASRPSK